MSASSEPAGNVTICPLCGESNNCGVAAGLSSCWCMSERVPEAVLAQIPDEARDRFCVCKACAAKASASATAANER
jgi:hypothetical protein